MKKLGLFISTFNEGNKLTRCVDSIVTQNNFSNIDVNIIFDCGNDETYEIAQKFSNIYENINLIITKENVGIAAARSLAQLYFHNYEYVTFMDGDDILASNALEFYFDLMSNYTDIDIFYNDLVFMRQVGNFCALSNKEKFIFTNASDLFYTFYNALFLFLFKVSSISHFEMDPNVAYDDLDYKFNFLNSNLNLCITNTKTIGYYYNPKGLTATKKSPEKIEKIRLTFIKYSSILSEQEMAYLLTKHYQEEIFDSKIPIDYFDTWYLTKAFVRDRNNFYEKTKAYFTIAREIKNMRLYAQNSLKRDLTNIKNEEIKLISKDFDNQLKVKSSEFDKLKVEKLKLEKKLAKKELQLLLYRENKLIKILRKLKIIKFY